MIQSKEFLGVYNRKELLDLWSLASWDFKIEEIAHALGMLCRFAGHSSRFYSVAEHSVLVSMNCAADAGLRMHGLLHDAHEGYIGDISSPLKAWLDSPELYFIIRKLDIHIYQSLGLERPTALERVEVKKIDRAALATEYRQLLPWSDAFDGELGCEIDEIHGWCPETAEQVFLDRYHELLAERK